MKKLSLFLICLGLIFLCSCSKESFDDSVEMNQRVETRAGTKTYNIGNISASSLATQAGMSSLCSNLYRQVYPVGGVSGLKVQDVGYIGKSIFKFETTGNSPYYVTCEPQSQMGVYKITLKSKMSGKDFNVLMVRMTQTDRVLSITPIDAELFLTRGVIKDIVGDLQVRAQRWWPCFENFFFESGQGKMITIVGALSGGVGHIILGAFAGVVALGCFG